jgi:hypothetical protein
MTHISLEPSIVLGSCSLNWSIKYGRWVTTNVLRRPTRWRHRNWGCQVGTGFESLGARTKLNCFCRRLSCIRIKSNTRCIRLLQLGIFSGGLSIDSQCYFPIQDNSRRESRRMQLQVSIGIFVAFFLSTDSTMPIAMPRGTRFMETARIKSSFEQSWCVCHTKLI